MQGKTADYEDFICNYHNDEYIERVCIAANCESRFICRLCQHEKDHQAFFQPILKFIGFNFADQVKKITEVEKGSDPSDQFKVQVLQMATQVLNKFSAQNNVKNYDSEIQSIMHSIEEIAYLNKEQRADLYSKVQLLAQQAKEQQKILTDKEYTQWKLSLAHDLKVEADKNYNLLRKPVTITSASNNRYFYVAASESKNSKNTKSYQVANWLPNDSFGNGHSNEDLKSKFQFIDQGNGIYRIYNNWACSFLYTDDAEYKKIKNEKGMKNHEVFSEHKRSNAIEGDLWKLESHNDGTFNIVNVKYGTLLTLSSVGPVQSKLDCYCSFNDKNDAKAKWIIKSDI